MKSSARVLELEVEKDTQKDAKSLRSLQVKSHSEISTISTLEV